MGKEYKTQNPRILLYASAENLSDYNIKKKTYLDCDDFAIVRHRKYLAESHEYIINDIKILKPDYIILPKTIYQTEYNFLNEIKGNAKIIPIYQMNARNINIRINKYPKLETKDLDNTLREW